MDLWQYLSETDKPIVMYGMGNGADKIIQRLEEKNIEISDFFASDGFVRGHLFRGKKVLSFSEIKEKYDNFIILLSFASCLDDVLEKIYALDSQYELYAPDVPVTGEGTFNSEFYLENKNKIEYASSLFEDDFSKKLFGNIVDFKLSGKISFLRETDNTTPASVLCRKEYPVCIDGGAYKGETAIEMAEKLNAKKIYSFEPDEKNFRKLCLASETCKQIIPINDALWNTDTTLEISSESNRNSSVFGTNGKMKLVKAIKGDTVIKEKADYIKLDVEGAEKEALSGLDEVIKTSHPDMLISCYHRNEDIFDLPIFIKEKYPFYKLYLRKKRYVPAWDVELYAIAPLSE